MYNSENLNTRIVPLVSSPYRYYLLSNKEKLSENIKYPFCRNSYVATSPKVLYLNFRVSENKIGHLITFSFIFTY